MTTRSGTLQGMNLLSRSLWQAAHGSENKQGAIRHIRFFSTKAHGMKRLTGDCIVTCFETQNEL